MRAPSSVARHSGERDGEGGVRRTSWSAGRRSPIRARYGCRQWQSHQDLTVRVRDIVQVMLKRLIDWINARRSRPPTREDLEAQREAKRIEDDLETSRVEERQSSARMT